MVNFNIKQDGMLILKGSYFYCEGHLAARPVEEQSKDSRYCRECLHRANKILEAVK